MEQTGRSPWQRVRPLRRLQDLGNRLCKGAGTRIAGGLLALTAAWALWMDLAQRVAAWCGLD